MKSYYKAPKQAYWLHSDIDWIQKEYTKDCKYEVTLYHYKSGGFFIGSFTKVAERHRPNRAYLERV